MLKTLLLMEEKAFWAKFAQNARRLQKPSNSFKYRKTDGRPAQATH
jgi:hypothetical protein